MDLSLSGICGRAKRVPARHNLLAYYRTSIADGRLIAYRPIGSATPQVKGSLFSGAGTGAVTGLLTTDTITTPHGTVTDGVEKVPDGNFDSGTTAGWADTTTGATKAVVDFSGREKVLKTTNIATSNVSQALPISGLTVGTKYRVSAFGFAPSGNTRVKAASIFVTETTASRRYINSEDTWESMSFDFVAAGVTTLLYVNSVATGALISIGDTAYFDNLSIQQLMQATPTCTTNGVLTISADCWDIEWLRDGVLIAYWPGINVSAAFELDASGNGHHLYLTTTTIVEALDGNGTNWANEMGFTVADGENQFLHDPGTEAIPDGYIIPSLADGSGSCAWSWGVDPLSVTINATPTDVTAQSMGIATVDIQWGTTHFEGSSDGGTIYTTLPTMNVETKTVFSRLDMKGTYCVDLRGLTHLKYVVDYTAGGLTNPANVSTVLFAEYPESFNTDITKASVFYEPDSSIVGTPALLTSGRTLDDVELSTGTLYAHAGENISKSINYGTSWLNVISSGEPWGAATLNNGAVRKLHNGKLLVIVANNAGQTEIYLSDVNEANFVKTYNFTQEGIVSPGFGLSVYQDIILFAPYKEQPRLSTDPLHAYASQDGGSTWSIVFTAPETATWHTHDIVYDPYSTRIWITNGDDFSRANVLYSDDFGATWHTLWADGLSSKSQFTSISIMPDCVIFGTDQVGYQGAYIWYRNNTGNTDVYEPCYSRGLPGRSGDASYRGKQYWDCDDVVYYTSKNPTSIIATKDGVNFYEVWVSPDPLETLNFICGVDVNNKIIGFGNHGALIATAPTWSEVTN